MEYSSLSGSSKRAKAACNTTQIPHCSVDGCNADLSSCRDYHRRHKVCEMHSKSPKVTIGDREQRFCQQCSRFHSLVEFDEGKRSCRKRLDGHNRRRRKLQPDSIPRNSGPVFSIQPSISGTTLLSFSNPQMPPTSSWAGAVKPENNSVLHNNQQQQQHQQINYFERQHAFLDSNTATRHSCSNQTIFSNQVVVESDRALSLLSSTPTQTAVTREFGLTAQTESPLPQAQSIVHDLQYGELGQYQFTQESKAIVSAADSGGSDVSTLHFPEMLRHGNDGSHQTLTFIWE